MSETAAVLFANDAFYLAFATRDLSAMEALWAKACPVACIHLGDSVLAATNIFVRQADGWKLAHHQAGPCNLSLAALEQSSDTPSMQ